MTFIEELWIAKDGVCLFHKHWTKEPIDLNIQLFSAFTTAINTFTKTFFPSQPLRSVDFMHTRFLFDYLDKKSESLVIMKFSTELPTARQAQLLKAFIIEFNKFAEEFNIKKSLTMKNKRKDVKPLNEFYYPIGSFVNSFVCAHNEDQSDIRKYHFLNVIWYIKSLNNIFTNILNDPKYKERNFNNIILKEYFDPTNYAMNRLTPIIFDIILKMNLSPEFDLKKFRNVFELDRFPDIPWHDIRHFLSDFIGYFSNMFNTIDDIPNKFRREIFKTYAENYKVLKYFELDDEVTTNLLPIFS